MENIIGKKTVVRILSYLLKNPEKELKEIDLIKNSNVGKGAGADAINRLFLLNMELYERSYDLRVQADYGRRSRIVELSKERVEEIINRVEKLISDTETELKSAVIL